MAKPRNNVYDPNYISQRENISIEEAHTFIEEYKKNKATSKENFIRKYGEEEGIKKYKGWVDKSLKKGWDSRGAHNSKFSKQYYLKRGESEDTASELARIYQHENSPLYIEYYIKRGKSLEYARKKIRAIHDKKIGKCTIYEKLKRENPEKEEDEIYKMRSMIKDSSSLEKIGLVKYNEKLSKTRATFESKGLWIPLDNMSDYNVYRRKVWYYTNLNDLSVLEHYEKRALAGTDGGYHLDHKFSISMGYIEGVPPELIGSIHNLIFIPWRENVIKQRKCSIQKDALYENQKNNT